MGNVRSRKDVTMYLGIGLSGMFDSETSPASGAWSLDAITAAVTQAETAAVDFVLLPDGTAETQGSPVWPEPTLLLSWLAAQTRHIGLIATLPVDNHQPYALARRFASVDLISAGRVGWHLPLSEDCQDAAARELEFSNIVLELWRGWAPDALLLDKSAGRFFDPDRMHVLNHSGAVYSVRGPLNVARSPQGAPVLAVTPTGEPTGEQVDADIVIGVPSISPPVSAARRFVRIAANAVDRAHADAFAAELLALASEGHDGFVLDVASTGAAAEVIDELVPRLRMLGCLRESSSAATLRARLGLSAEGGAA
jgi:alkanesulfonate monooxygenase SsuD/methylene tetrahydromethanopterin reductase-like flavin-dependent oxidoreductase (luciferase family)